VIDVRLLLDGRPAGRLPVEVGSWTEVAMLLPPQDGRGPRFRRLDLQWTAPAQSAQLEIGREAQ